MLSGIRYGGHALSKPGQPYVPEASRDPQQWTETWTACQISCEAVRAQERLDAGIRNTIEGTYGNAKRKQGLSRIKAKLETTIGIIESIVDETAEWKAFGSFAGILTMDVEGFQPDYQDRDYLEQLHNSIENRIRYVESLKEFKGGRDILPEEALFALQSLL